MGISNLQPRSSGETSRVSAVYVGQAMTTSVTSNTLKNVLDVSGRGAVMVATVNGTNQGVQYAGQIKITIDDVVVFQGVTANSITSEVGIKTDPNSTNVYGASMPYASGSGESSKYLNIYEPIEFYKNFKMEITLQGVSASCQYNYKYLLR